jgi:hypothetical protein
MYYRIKKLCIKLVIKTSLYYDARSEKHQITYFNLFKVLKNPPPHTQACAGRGPETTITE